VIAVEAGPVRPWLVALACIALAVATASAAAGPAAAEPQAAAAPLAAKDTTEQARSAERTRIYLGMWSTHIRDIAEGMSPNSLIGLAWRGYFGATFINSFGDRSVAVGLQRNFSPSGQSAVTTALGYRFGLVTGYDDRFFGIGHMVPALPFAQLVGTIDFRSLGLELNYSGIVASFVLNWRI
jgi:hypothetical protein